MAAECAKALKGIKSKKLSVTFLGRLGTHNDHRDLPNLDSLLLFVRFSRKIGITKDKGNDWRFVVFRDVDYLTLC